MPTILRKTENPIPAPAPPRYKTEPDSRTLPKAAKGLAGPARRVTRSGR